MTKFVGVAVIALFVISCETEECVDDLGYVCTNGFWDAEDLDIVFSYVEMELFMDGYDLDVHSLGEQHNLLIVRVDQVAKEHVPDGYRQNQVSGLYFTDSSYIQVVDVHSPYEGTSAYSYTYECHHEFSVMGHELLHFVADKYLDRKDESAEHNVDNFWGRKETDSIEYRVSMDMLNFCQYKYSPSLQNVVNTVKEKQ